MGIGTALFGTKGENKNASQPRQRNRRGNRRCFCRDTAGRTISLLDTSRWPMLQSVIEYAIDGRSICSKSTAKSLLQVEMLVRRGGVKVPLFERLPTACSQLGDSPQAICTLHVRPTPQPRWTERVLCKLGISMIVFISIKRAAGRDEARNRMLARSAAHRFPGRPRAQRLT